MPERTELHDGEFLTRAEVLARIERLKDTLNKFDVVRVKRGGWEIESTDRSGLTEVKWAGDRVIPAKSFSDGFEQISIRNLASALTEYCAAKGWKC